MAVCSDEDCFLSLYIHATRSDSIAVPLPESISFLRQSYLPAGEQNPEEPNTISEGTPSSIPSNLPPFYPVTVIGGTFDHLHAGHKILLSMAAYITSQKLIIGITGTVLKKNYFLLFKKRKKVVLKNLSRRHCSPEENQQRRSRKHRCTDRAS